ncbi:hypothetical protein B0H17DRAFT_1210559 [Mycena rosella]|uniref:Uncharacterized protein n=1 Tax=Mycena rosella TaxID=1033263 RepID=A0AAD7G8P4_MYCRO|nr:hypothetical protein B0H17DRAFT_1210559 [Mycena rosella]
MSSPSTLDNTFHCGKCARMLSLKKCANGRHAEQYYVTCFSSTHVEPFYHFFPQEPEEPSKLKKTMMTPSLSNMLYPEDEGAWLAAHRAQQAALITSDAHYAMLLSRQDSPPCSPIPSSSRNGAPSYATYDNGLDQRDDEADHLRRLGVPNHFLPNPTPPAPPVPQKGKKRELLITINSDDDDDVEITHYVPAIKQERITPPRAVKRPCPNLAVTIPIPHIPAIPSLSSSITSSVSSASLSSPRSPYFPRYLFATKKLDDDHEYNDHE